MGDISLFEVSFWLIVAGSVGFQLWRLFFRRCKVCNERMKLERIEDPMGLNFGKYFSLTFYKGPRRYIETYKCGNCGSEQTVKDWGY